ncbi:oligosaccharide flippase family protein [Bacillus aquiflavi]|uniref:Oligosaccharide flippase family protein n=1 Tax=Bacillus aquiflavi TaxID=2672567 RepID=A0A6B3W250_9BACI|nr:oligosaccharide flippase family protein [Bacillus aquiflavi]MBA4537729.1 oligosaccharide flippase family protein [Bacillus aquiflavi]NEY81986.1 oligosaccharide flippase family protein [Bacillus aquiflavi]UAC47606.1 oligosaccharide flippase family protein [Bacillus aquiflavi]
MSSKLLRGTFILTLATIISKILGLFYVIPFKALVGDAVLYTYAYVPYTIFISIATAGVPLAVSKYISKYNTLGEYAVGRKLFKSGLLIMTITGVVSFLVLYMLAPIVAPEIIVDTDQTTKVEDVVTVIRSVSFALILVPVMSLIRGFFQGHESMGPSAVSQVVEQIIRIGFVLIGAFVVLKIMDGDIVSAISVATFAAFIGAAGGLIVLIWYWLKRKPYFDQLLKKDKGTMDISLKDIYWEIIQYSIPFVIVGIANPLFQLIDQFTFNRAMSAIGLAAQSDTSLGIINFDTHKLVIIPVSLATAFSLTLIPSVTKAFTERDRQSMTSQLNQTFQVVLFLTLPAVVGISLLAEPTYTVFYGHNQLGADVLQVYAPVAILFAFFSVTAAILQGINEQRFTILSLLVGLLIKLSLNIPLIKIFETKGAVYATALGYLAAVIINIIVIKLFARYSFRLVIHRSLLISFFTFLMFIGAAIVYKLLGFVLTPDTRMESLIIIIICAVVGAGIYFYLSFRTQLMNVLFGERADRLRKKLRLPF